MTDAAGDRTVLAHIDELVAEEKELRRAHAGEGMTDADRERLRQVEGQLDQAWDLLRQRRAAEEFHTDPDAAGERSVDTVTHYRQ